MKQCNVCGKYISDFSTNCPYCDAVLTVGNNQKNKSGVNPKSDIENVLLLLHIVLTFLIGFLYPILQKYIHEPITIRTEGIMLNISSHIAFAILMLVSIVVVIIKRKKLCDMNMKRIIIAVAISFSPLIIDHLIIDWGIYGGITYLISGTFDFYAWLISLSRYIMAGIVLFCISNEAMYLIGKFQKKSIDKI